MDKEELLKKISLLKVGDQAQIDGANILTVTNVTEGVDPSCSCPFNIIWFGLLSYHQDGFSLQEPYNSNITNAFIN